MTMSDARANRPRPDRRGLRKLHRWTGLAAAVFLLLLAATGIALNHAESLGLDRRYLAAPWLLDRYNIDAAAIDVSFAAGGRRITQAAGRLFLDELEIDAAGVDRIVGAVGLDDEIAVAGTAEVLFLSGGGEIVDRAAVGLYLPGPVQAVAAATAGLWLMSAGDAYFYEVQNGKLADQPDRAARPAWVAPAALPAGLRAEIERAYRGTGISVERLLLDLHSGRLFGFSGTLVTDLAALAIGVLAVSGILIWIRR